MGYRKIKEEDIKVGLKFFIDIKDEETGKVEHCPFVIKEKRFGWFCEDLEDGTKCLLTTDVLLDFYCEG